LLSPSSWGREFFVIQNLGLKAIALPTYPKKTVALAGPSYATMRAAKQLDLDVSVKRTRLLRDIE
jgi:hypothetical protein